MLARDSRHMYSGKLQANGEEKGRDAAQEQQKRENPPKASSSRERGRGWCVARGRILRSPVRRAKPRPHPSGGNRRSTPNPQFVSHYDKGVCSRCRCRKIFHSLPEQSLQRPTSQTKSQNLRPLVLLSKVKQKGPNISGCR